VVGGRLKQSWLAIIAACLLPAGLLTLLGTTPWLPGALVFVILFGLGSGLFSIVSGTLPLELFGRHGYGAMVGWGSAARQFAAAFAPFGLSAMLAALGVQPALLVLAVLALIGVAAFSAIAVLQRQPLTPPRE
jgi:MFS family permease